MKFEDERITDFQVYTYVNAESCVELGLRCYLSGRDAYATISKTEIQQMLRCLESAENGDN